ncbi:hypothetical protein PG984_009986 [Apiospora sp. TS-2023a]
MRTFNLCAAAGALVWHQAAASSALPPTTGPYHVGLQKHAVPYLNEADPVWPDNISNSFLVTLYYPTKQEPETRDLERPYLDPATAALYEELYNLTAGDLSTIASPGLIQDAKPLDHPSSSAPLPPTLFFGPGGGGPPSECYTTLLSDLASHGYVVLAMDHAYEQPFVRYPNGTGIYGLPILYPWTESMALAAQSARVKDSLALLDYLPTLEAETKVKLNQTHVGIFGGSLGGSAAAATLLAAQQQQNTSSSISNPRRSFRAGINLDGTFFGPLADVRQPFLILGQEGHGVPSNNSANDATWPAFVSAQKTAYWRWVNLKGTLHHDFSDIGYWKELVPGLGERDGRVGPIEGKRLVEVWRAYVRAFFDLALMGRATAEEDALLNEGADAEWPEKTWEGGGGSLT